MNLIATQDNRIKNELNKTKVINDINRNCDMTKNMNSNPLLIEIRKYLVRNNKQKH